jgi:D-3-phosphoglycerate dehydrogenase
MVVKPRIVVADLFYEGALEELRELAEVIYLPQLKSEELSDILNAERASILVVRSTRFSSALEGANNLSWVIRAGSGVHPDDLTVASSKGIAVSNCPGMNAVAVAELTLGLILAIDRNLVACVNESRSGSFAKKRLIKTSWGLAGRTLGLLGFGFISQAVARRAVAFEMEVVAAVRSIAKYESEARELGVTLVSSHLELPPRCDVISVHIPYAPENDKLLGEDFFSAMRVGAIFVNTSRAELIDEAAMRAANIRVGLDVVSGTEPASEDLPWKSNLLEWDSAIVTPHIGASTAQAQEQTCMEVVRLIGDYLEIGERHNLV